MEHWQQAIADLRAELDVERAVMRTAFSALVQTHHNPSELRQHWVHLKVQLAMRAAAQVTVTTAGADMRAALQDAMDRWDDLFPPGTA